MNDPAAFEGDALHALLVLRADELVGCTEGSPEEAELEAIADAIEGYEAIRWPDGVIPGWKGVTRASRETQTEIGERLLSGVGKRDAAPKVRNATSRPPH